MSRDCAALLELQEDIELDRMLREQQKIFNGPDAFTPALKGAAARVCLRLGQTQCNRQGMLFDAWGGWI